MGEEDTDMSLWPRNTYRGGGGGKEALFFLNHTFSTSALHVSLRNQSSLGTNYDYCKPVS